jgi:hypothetical protein
LPRLNLTALLALTALLDLLVRRLAERLFLPTAWHTRPAGAALHGVALFSGQLLALLGLVVFAVAAAGIVRRQELFPRGMRLYGLLFAVLFGGLALATIALPRVPERILLHLKTTQAFLLWILAFASSRGPAPWRAKLGATLFAFPGILHAVASFAAHVGWSRPELGPADLARAGEFCAFAAAAAAPRLMMPPRGGARLVAAAVGVFAATLALAALVVRFDVVQTLALYGLRLELPAPGGAAARAYLALFVLAVGGAAAFVAGGLARSGPPRLAAWGVLIMACVGYQVAGPGEIVASTVGLLAICVAVTRAGAEA